MTRWSAVRPRRESRPQGEGREALRRYMDLTLRSPFTGTSHHIGGHVIEFEDPDHAQGIVYSKNEHETGEEWVIMQMMYADDYERQDGRWGFRRRLPLYWYATDLNKPPIGEKKMRWPDTEWSEGNFHKLFPSFAEFWSRDGAPEGPVRSRAGRAVHRLHGRGRRHQRVKVRAD